MIINEEAKLKQFIKNNNLAAEHIRFEKSMHTVKQCVDVSGFPIDQITKTMIFKGPKGKTVAAMVPAEFRVSSSRLRKATGFEDLELANPSESHKRTGYPVGGMPFFGYECILVVDPRVLEEEFIYTGGGSEFSLTKISTSELKRITTSIIQRIRGKKSN